MLQSFWEKRTLWMLLVTAVATVITVLYTFGPSFPNRPQITYNIADGFFIGAVVVGLVANIISGAAWTTLKLLFKLFTVVKALAIFAVMGIVGIFIMIALFLFIVVMGGLFAIIGILLFPVAPALIRLIAEKVGYA